MCRFVDIVIEITNVKVSKLFSHSPHLDNTYLSTFLHKLFATAEKPFCERVLAVRVTGRVAKYFTDNFWHRKLSFRQNINPLNVNKS